MLYKRNCFDKKGRVRSACKEFNLKTNVQKSRGNAIRKGNRTQKIEAHTQCCIVIDYIVINYVIDYKGQVIVIRINYLKMKQ